MARQMFRQVTVGLGKLGRVAHDRAVAAGVIHVAGVFALRVAGGLLVLAVGCTNAAIERVVDDISTVRRAAARQAKDCAPAAVAIPGLAVGVAWVCVIAGVIL